MYGAAGSTPLRSYPPRLGVKFQPDEPTSLVNFGPCCALLPQEYSPMGQHTPTSSTENKATLVSSKSRIKWTQLLHNKFMECVGILGGAEKATPKGILRLMGVEGLTIYHVKSHLQKYRVTHSISDSKQGKLKKPVFDLQTVKQLAETFKMQLDAQMQLHQQLQVQNDLQLKIEEQGRQLKLLLEHRLKQQPK